MVRISSIVALGCVLRALTMIYGEWQDSHMVVKYTDVDYKVFSDAAALVAAGRSPFERATFRYSPLLAYLLVPNGLFPSWGKFLFGVADVGVGLFHYKILGFLKLSPDRTLLFTALWVLNPLAINVSTRGSADSLVGVMILGCMYGLLKGYLVAPAIVYGLAVHFRIYPIIYALAIFLFLGQDSDADRKSRLQEKGFFTRLSFISRVHWQRQLVFTIVSAATFLLLTTAMYLLYGQQSLDQCYFYHLTRADNRHNFSVYFYDIYLRHAEGSLQIIHPVLVGMLAFVPQAATLLSFTILFAARDLPFCMLMLTIAFVAFNKVCTAQYFLWYLMLLPLVLPFSGIRLRFKGISLLGAWFATEGHWLYWAFQLEFMGSNVFLQVWFAGILFFCVHIWIMVELIRHHHFRDERKKIC